jgi:hypothetical protein
MLRVPAGQLGNPVAMLVLVKACDGLFGFHSSGEVLVPQEERGQQTCARQQQEKNHDGEALYRAR